MSFKIPLSLETRVVRNNAIFMSEIDDELVCLDEASANYYGLNNTGKQVWEMLQEPVTVQSVIQAMIKKYPDVDTVEGDVLKYLDALYHSSEINPLLLITEK